MTRTTAADAPSTTASVVAAAKGKVAAAIQSTAQKTAAVAEKTVAAVADKAKTTATATAQLAKNVASTAETKLVRTASLMQVGRVAAAASPSAAPANTNSGRFAAQSPNQIINSRGYWTPGGASDTAPQSSGQVALQNALNARMQVASADPNMPIPVAGQDRVPTDLALGYAEQPGRASPSAAIAAATAAATGGVMAQNGMTTAAKDSSDRPQSSVQRAIQLATAAVKVGQRMDSPWLRAIVLSPSVHRFMSTLAFGARDLTSLAALMVKPASAVMMTFSNDPTMGLPHDHFTRGSAIVFMPTVTYPTRTASLQ